MGAQSFGTGSNTRATKRLTSGSLNVKLMPMFEDAVRAMISRLKYESDRVTSIREEMDKLSGSYNRYRDLLQALSEAESRIKRIQAVLGPTLTKTEQTGIIADTSEVWPAPGDLRANLVLWEAIAEYLCHIPEATVDEIRIFLEGVGIENVSRQAVESALRAHAKLFRITKRGKEKHIALRQ
jgi:hypothetical protein